MSKKNQNYTNRKQNRFQPERMRGNVFVNNSGKQWLPGENGRAAKVERLLRGAKEEKKEIAGNMAGYKDSGIKWIGAIPKEWKVDRTKYHVIIKNGKDPVERGDIPVYGSGKESFRTCGEYKTGPAVLLGRKGSILEPKYVEGKFWNVDTAFDAYTKKDMVLKYFFYAACCFDCEKLSWTTTIPSMTQTGYGNLNIPLPPLPEQQRIAGFLDTKCDILDRTIDAVSRQIEDLEKYKKALITKTVTKGICKKGEPERAMKDSGVEWIGKVPEEWSVKRLKYVLDSIRNGAPAAAVEYSPELPRYVRITDIDDNGRLKETGKQSLPEDIAKRYMLDKEAVLIASVGSLGKTMLFNPDTEKEKCAFAGYLIETVTNPEAMNSKFLFYFIKSNAYMDWANRNFVQTTIQNLSAGRHKNLPVTVPPLAEQQQIADYLDEKCKNIDNRVQKRRQQLEWLKEYKKSLIFDYVTGKKRV